MECIFVEINQSQIYNSAQFRQKYQLSHGAVQDGKYFTSFEYFANVLYAAAKYKKQVKYLANIARG